MDSEISQEIDKRIEHCRDNIHGQLLQLNRTLADISLKIDDHIDKEEGFRDEIMKAFPENDAYSHRHYHELVIKREEKRAKLQDAIIEKSLSGLFWAAIVGIGAAMWNSFKDNLK